MLYDQHVSLFQKLAGLQTYAGTNKASLKHP